MEKILLVEDNAPLCWLIERMLRGKYCVTLMNSAIDAVAWLSDGNDCDMVITDLEMPGLNGIELLQFLRQSGLHNTLPVIVLSANEDRLQESINEGASCFILKPFNPQRLIEDIKTVLLRRGQLAL